MPNKTNLLQQSFFAKPEKLIYPWSDLKETIFDSALQDIANILKDKNKYPDKEQVFVPTYNESMNIKVNFNIVDITTAFFELRKILANQELSSEKKLTQITDVISTNDGPPLFKKLKEELSEKLSSVKAYKEVEATLKV